MNTSDMNTIWDRIMNKRAILGLGSSIFLTKNSNDNWVLIGGAHSYKGDVLCSSSDISDLMSEYELLLNNSLLEKKQSLMKEVNSLNSEMAEINSALSDEAA